MDTIALNTVNRQDFAVQREPELLPTTIVEGAARYADMVEGTDAILTADEAFDQLYARMGWTSN